MSPEQLFNKSLQFFWDNAGWSYDPKTQTSEEGRLESAQALVISEYLSIDKGFSFVWDNDSDNPNELCCVCLDRNGVVLSSLCGIDLGKNADPYTNEYSRVIKAELALEALIDYEEENILSRLA